MAVKMDVWCLDSAFVAYIQVLNCQPNCSGLRLFCKKETL